VKPLVNRLRRLRRLRPDRRGISAVEFALLAPAFLGAIIGAGQVGILFLAQAGLRNAVGDAARCATIWPRPSDATIKARMATNRFGLNTAYLGTPTVTSGTSNGATYLDISATYNVPLDFVFYHPPAITLRETRRVFVQSQLATTQPTCV